eukprot:434717_1
MNKEYMDSEFINNIKVGDCVDVYREYIGSSHWFLMRVEAVNTTSITAADLIDTLDREVIEKSTDYLAPLNTHTINIVALPSSLKRFTSSVFIYEHGLKYPEHCYPIYDAQSNSIMSAAYHTAHRNLVIIKYDIALDNTKYLTTINIDKNDTYKPYPIRAQTFDPKSRKFFIFVLSEKNEVLIVVNIDSLEHTIENLDQFDEIQKTIWNSNAIIISSENECYLFDDEYHMIISDDSICAWIKDITPDEKFQEIYGYFHYFIYVEACNKLFKFCNYDSEYENHNKGFGIFYCDIAQQESGNTLNWKNYVIDMDLSTYRMAHAVLCFDHILFLFLLTDTFDQLILAVDVLYDRLFYDISIKHISYFAGIDSLVYAVKTKNNDIHVISFHWGSQYKFSVYDIIPNNMKQFYLDKQCPIVYAFIKQIEKETKSNVPDCLYALILSYFPLFL